MKALDETAHERNIELTQNWNLTGQNIVTVLQAMMADLDTGWSQRRGMSASETGHRMGSLEITSAAQSQTRATCAVAA